MKTMHWMWIWIAYSGLCIFAAGIFITRELWEALVCMAPAFLMAINGIFTTLSMIRRFGKD